MFSTQKGVYTVEISKYDLCDSCREIYTGDGNITIESFIDGELYQHLANKPEYTAMVWKIHRGILEDLERYGGCSDCINLLSQATQS